GSGAASSNAGAGAGGTQALAPAAATVTPPGRGTYCSAIEAVVSPHRVAPPGTDAAGAAPAFRVGVPLCATPPLPWGAAQAAKASAPAALSARVRVSLRVGWSVIVLSCSRGAITPS